MFFGLDVSYTLIETLKINPGYKDLHKNGGQEITSGLSMLNDAEGPIGLGFMEKIFEGLFLGTKAMLDQVEPRPRAGLLEFGSKWDFLN